MLSPVAKVRVAANNFLTAGGDGFTAFEEGTDRLTGDIDVNALVAYFRSHSPVSPGPQSRIKRAMEEMGADFIEPDLVATKDGALKRDSR